MKWFRLYTEARSDPKLHTLTDAEHRVWFNLLCFAAEPDGDARGTIDVRDFDWLAAQVARGKTDLLHRTLGKLSQMHVIAQRREGIVFLNFSRRQYQHPSDEPAKVRARVKRHRNGSVTRGKRGVTR